MWRDALMKAAASVVSVLASGGVSLAEDPGVILPLRERAEVIDAWRGERLERLAPGLMRESGIDLWVLIAREYDEDPVLETMLPATWLSARRRTILVLHDPGEGAPLERLAVARYNVGDHFESAWDPEEQPDQWARLAKIIEERDPRRLGINVSETFGHADGLAHTQHGALMAALPERYRERVVSAETLAVRWLETRLPEELDAYASICRIAHEIMAEALSERVIQPGVTTTEDVEWWCRERAQALGLRTWFHPTVSVQRREGGRDFIEMFDGDDEVIRRGDLVHLDFGITYLRLNSDTQQMAYVLRRGETAPPEGLRRAFAIGNEMQDVLTERFAEGRTGNETLRAALEEAGSRGIDAMVYTHPIGSHGHGAGPAIGMWDRQGGVPGSGDSPIRDRTAFSIELSVTAPVPEWDGQRVRIMLEENAAFEDGRVRYLDGRQRELHVVR